jgi:hypothetical protein
MTLVSVCAWCPDAREKTRQAIAAGHDVTHGICESCVAKFDEQIAERKAA